MLIINKSLNTSWVNWSFAERDALHLLHVTLTPAAGDKVGAGDMSNPLIWIMSSKSESSQSLYLVSWWVGTVPKPGRWTSRSGCGPAGPSGSRSICSPCRAQCDFRRPGCAPAAPSTAAPARRRCTSAVAPRTRLTGRHGNFIKNHFLDLFGICFAA